MKAESSQKNVLDGAAAGPSMMQKKVLDGAAGRHVV